MGKRSALREAGYRVRADLQRRLCEDQTEGSFAAIDKVASFDALALEGRGRRK